MPTEGLVDWQYLARINFLCRARTEFQGLIEIELQGRFKDGVPRFGEDRISRFVEGGVP
jgi:hypothetical protein